MIVFNLKYEFYNMIKSEQKTHEYRLTSNFWNKRLKNLSVGDKIKLVKGYSKEHLIAIVIEHNIIREYLLPRYAKNLFACSSSTFHDIEFKLLKKGRYMNV